MGDKGKTYSQKKRNKLDYRREYFSKNPGLFGCIWFCAYCHKPILGREGVEVDHIMPLNSVLGQNASYNLVAACSRCNRKKSDTVDGRVIHGYFSKILEVIIFTLQKIIVVGVVGFFWCLQKIVSCFIKLLLVPFNKTSILTKVIYTLILIGICIYFINGQ